ncbi:MAG: purine-binding chemotaxis protein CheW [Nitrospirae bacterium]|nr:purine-binding chemotaxis protein CheW [Nitrospirota bacterium]
MDAEKGGAVKTSEEKNRAVSDNSTNTNKNEEPDMTAEVEILAFKIANEEYAVKITELQEIIRYQRITIVPCTPLYVLGVTSLRGKIIPVIDLKIRLGLNGGVEAKQKKQKILILSGNKEPLGALVSLILGVFRLPASELLPPPPTLTEEEKNYIDGIVKIKNRFISILNVNAITRMGAL